MRHVAVRRIHTALEAIRAMESEFISAQVAVGAVRAPAVNAILAEITVGTPVHDVASDINIITARKRDAILFFIILSSLKIISSLKFKHTYPIL